MALAALLAGALAAASWHYSAEIIEPTPREPLDRAVRVLELDDSSMTLPVATRADKGSAWFVEWRDGYGMLGPVLSRSPASVTRRLRVLHGRPPDGTPVDLTAFPFQGDPATVAGISFRTVEIPSPLGAFPAWRVSGPRDTWVIFVHGLAAGRAEALRALPAVTRAGFPSLAISYRNGPDAPRGPDGLCHLGATEWEDLEAAVHYAQGNGARRIVLIGFSMGGAIVADFLHESQLAASVVGVVLDAPVVDWDATIQLAAAQRHVPAFLTALAEWVVGLRTGFDWRGFAGRIPAKDFRTPVLLFHGTADAVVPLAGSEALAGALGPRVTFVEVPGAGHMQSWNFEPQGYEAVLSQWLTEVAPDSSGAASGAR